MIALNELALRPVPRGPFVMGHDPQPGDLQFVETEEYPERVVYLSDFSVMRSPVTVGLWKRFLNQAGYDWDRSSKDSPHLTGAPMLSLATRSAASDDYPITYVTWHDCTAFTAWLNITFGGGFSLPTEAQWEKACRGCDGRLYPWGNDYPTEAVITSPDFRIDFYGIHPVGWRPDRRSPYGCLDMWYNVGEWCLDWFSDTYYDDRPDDVNDPTGPASGIHKVVRGGGFDVSTGWPRCTDRSSYFPPTWSAPDIGFRLVFRGKL
jgi:formylglycine-generating enzyme required for sulfatase activity